jgi:hypothetical protein
VDTHIFKYLCADPIFIINLTRYLFMQIRSNNLKEIIDLHCLSLKQARMDPVMQMYSYAFNLDQELEIMRLQDV